MDGMIDEVRIYDRVLDEDEVAQNFGVKLRGAAIEPGSKIATTWDALNSEDLTFSLLITSTRIAWERRHPCLQFRAHFYPFLGRNRRKR